MTHHERLSNQCALTEGAAFDVPAGAAAPPQIGRLCLIPSVNLGPTGSWTVNGLPTAGRRHGAREIHVKSVASHAAARGILATGVDQWPQWPPICAATSRFRRRRRAGPRPDEKKTPATSHENEWRASAGSGRRWWWRSSGRLEATGGTPGTRPDRPLLNGVPSPFIKTAGRPYHTAPPRRHKKTAQICPIHERAARK